MPAHDESAVEFRAGKGRYRVDQETFLRVAAPLGIAPKRWYRSVLADLPNIEEPGDEANIGPKKP